MTRYAFLIDQDTCIGCHACTVACKSEHDVPLGVNRTWVKYIEKGEFPNARRFWSVNRCNHCADAPCVTICPTAALYSRADGIVDFDDSRCIGCKSCMNACPYDALYINPQTQTAHKCNFCSHRVEVGLEPSCVVVCPTQSIVAGDLDDPESRIVRMLARHDTTVRAPEQGTRPHVFYKGADEAALDPLRTRIASDGMIWADTTADHPTLPVDPPGSAAQVVARTAYTTMHPMPWKGRVSAYLVTKAISGGALIAAAVAQLADRRAMAGSRALVGIAAPLVSLVFAALTGLLLVIDLRQPKRFFYLFTKPQWRSWVTRGAFVLLVHGLFGVLWAAGGVLDRPGLVRAMAVPGALGGAAVAGYTAFLFAQCEGRDLWQTPLLGPMLIAQAVTAGSAALAVATPFVDAPAPVEDALAWMLVGGLGAFVALLLTEHTSRGSVHVEIAKRALSHGAYAARWWAGLVLGLAGVALTVGALSTAGAVRGALTVVAALCALVALAAYEDGFVRAGQSVPLS